MNRLDREKLEDCRLQIARLCNIPSSSILLNETGQFEMHNIAETDKNNIIQRLRNDTLIQDVQAFSSGYNFSRMNYAGIPQSKYTIIGEINFNSFNVDDNTSDILM